jgi:Mrp family chromosome partitioning ATPase
MNQTAASAPSSLRAYLAAVRRQWLIVAAVLVVSLAAAGAWVSRQESVYASEMKIVVGQGQALFGPDVSFAVEPFTQTMTDLLESEVIADRVINELNLDISASTLRSRLEVSTKPDASVLNVTYEDTDRERSRVVLQAIGDTFTELVDTRLGGESEQAQTPQEGSGETQPQPVTATVFDPAHTLPDRVEPKPVRTMVIAGVLGLIAGILLALVRDAFSNRIRGHSDAQDAFGVRVTGVLPPGTVGTRPSQIQHLPPRLSARIGDALEILGATIRLSSEGNESGVVLITSGLPEEGKTTVVANVSAMLARSGMSVIAVEADLRRPALHRYLEVPADQPGLTDVARGEAMLSDVLVPVSLPLSTRTRMPTEATVGEGGGRAPVSWGSGGSGRGFLMLPAGTDLGETHDVFTMGHTAELVAQLRGLADYVIFDSAPLLLTPDAFPLAQLADKVIVVARQDATTRDDAENARETLGSLRVRDFSVVLTEAREAERRPYGYEGVSS